MCASLTYPFNYFNKVLTNFLLFSLAVFSHKKTERKLTNFHLFCGKIINFKFATFANKVFFLFSSVNFHGKPDIFNFKITECDGLRCIVIHIRYVLKLSFYYYYYYEF